MKQTFRERRFNAEALADIDRCNAIIVEYQDQGFKLTLRQLYYQLVSKDLIPNTEKSYKRIGNLVSDGRLAGIIDWDAIEDRGRVPRSPFYYSGVDQVVRTWRSLAETYNLDRWKGQGRYVEVWVEKDALAGVLSPLAEEHHVTLMVNKGYSSQSAMYESAMRFIRNAGDDDAFLLYLGDFDPSGEDMVRDIKERMAMFGVSDLRVAKVALTKEQIRRYKPPPNPAKITDPRAKRYIELHGDKSWEVDALPPRVLSEIIKSAITKLVDTAALKAVFDEEKKHRKQLIEMLER